MRVVESPQRPGSGARVRPELPVHRVVVLVVDGVDVPADEGRGADAVRGAGFEVAAGTLTLLTPARAGRAVVLHLAGVLGRTAGSVLTGSGPDRLPLEDSTWRLAVGRPVTPPATGDRGTVSSVLDPAGPAARRAARRRRLGLDEVLDRAVADLDPGRRALVGVATALAAGADVVAVDDPDDTLSGDALGTVLDALRDLVDVDGRTVVVTADEGAIPAHVRPLLDVVVDLDRPSADAP